MRKIILFSIFYFLSSVICPLSFADTVTFNSPVVWRADSNGDYAFKGNGLLEGAAIAKDGAVECSSSSGTCELTAPCVAEDIVLGLTLNWKFTGKVTMEASVSDIPDNYFGVVNGVPVEIKNNFGTKIKWRAKLSAGSRLEEVRLAYTDMSGVIGGFGSPKLTGFQFRKQIVIASPAKQGEAISSDLFNHQVKLTIGESAKAKGVDTYLKGVLEAGFIDAAFTQADGETLIPFYRQEITGKKPDRAAIFWLKVPQLPASGLPIYIYYGRPSSVDLSSGGAAFEFFDDFGAPFDTEKWEKGLDVILSPKGAKDLILEYKDKTDGKIKTLDMTTTAKDDIIKFFQVSKDYAWARVRKEIASAASGGLAMTSLRGTSPERASDEAISEEAPNLAAFIGTTVAPNGDLALEESFTEGEYYSPVINAPFKTRIIVPEWKTVVPITPSGKTTSPSPHRGEGRGEGESVSIFISADNGAMYTKDCESGKYYYASKNDFAAGNALRWKAVIASPSSPSLRGTSPERASDEAISKSGIASAASRPRNDSLARLSFDFRPGVITLTSPDGGETAAAGASYPVVWSAQEYEPSYGMKIEFSSDAGKAYVVLDRSAPNTGKYAWQVTKEYTDKALIKVSDSLEPSVYDKSNGYFSIGTDSSSSLRGAAEGRDEAISGDAALQAQIEEEARLLGQEEQAKARPGAKLYDVVIKVFDKNEKSPPGFYEEGDIVMIKPAGFLWGAEEKKKFLIIQAYLTDKEVKEMMEPQEDAGGKIVKKRKFKIDLTKQGLLEKKRETLRGMLKSKPLVAREAVEEKK